MYLGNTPTHNWVSMGLLQVSKLQCTVYSIQQLLDLVSIYVQEHCGSPHVCGPLTFLCHVISPSCDGHSGVLDEQLRGLVCIQPAVGKGDALFKRSVWAFAQAGV